MAKGIVSRTVEELKELNFFTLKGRKKSERNKSLRALRRRG